MAQYYTLDEASKKLGLKVDEFRKKLATEWKNVRRFPDGATLRFQAREIDELARTLGRASDPDLQLGDAPLSLVEEPGPAIASKKPADQTVFLNDSDSDFVPLSLDDDHVIASSKSTKSGSDSDVKLEPSGKHKPKNGGDEPTEVLELKDEGPKSSKKNLQATRLDVKSDSPKKPAAGKANQVSSEFDLTLDSDSDEFDLQLTDDDSDEVNLSEPTKKKGPRGGDSGINLADPQDSGISLEKDSSEFELQLEDSSPVAGDRDSEFELSLDDPPPSNSQSVLDSDQKDIFETDFELPQIDDSSSEDRSDLENSDFDLSIDDSVDAEDEESGSQVVAVEEDDAADDLEPIEDEDEAPVRTLAAPAAPANWGVLPVAVMAPCLLVMFFGVIMSYELLSSMWGYHTNSKGGGTIVRVLAEWFNGEPLKD